MSAPVLSAHDLVVRFGGLVALDGVNLTVFDGEILGLLGPNGSGKTTFFNVVTGLYTAASGKILLSDDNINGKSPQQIYRLGITRTFQRSRLSLGLTVFDNMVLGNYQRLRMSLWFNLLERKKLKAQYDEMVDQTHALLHTFSAPLADKLFQAAGTLTMIDRRRVEICRALLCGPRLVLLDEPSAGMTRDESSELMEDILQIRGRLKPFTIVIIEHEMNVIRHITERCIVLASGKKIAEGSYAQIVADPQVQSAYLGRERT